MNCDYAGIPVGRNTNPTHNLSFYSAASGVTNNGSYDMRYAAGDHSSETDYACNNGTKFNGGQNIIASTTGVWSGKGPILMPNLTGTLTVCTVPLDGNASKNFVVANHTLWTLF